MKLLVTGATGYLGSHIIRALLIKGHEIIILKRSFSNTTRINDITNKLKLYNVDTDSIDKPFEENPRIDAIIHTATSYGRLDEKDSVVLETNTLFPLKLLEEATIRKVKTFINTDSSLPRFINPYSLAKKQFKDWGKMYAKQKKIKFLNLKLEHFYGPEDDETKFISWVIKSCQQNVKELKLTSGEQERDFIYIDDVVQAYFLIINKITTFQESYNEVEIGSGETVSIKQLVKMIHQITDSQTKISFGAIPYRLNEVMHSQADTSVINNLGWTPRISLKNGLIKTINTGLL
jgi:nucleoside-diphosphate-sugar epimerase